MLGEITLPVPGVFGLLLSTRVPLFFDLLDKTFAHQAVHDRMVGEGFDRQAFLAHKLQSRGDRFRLDARDVGEAAKRAMGVPRTLPEAS